MENKSKWIYETLLGHYGDLGWWPGAPYEIMVGAVLVQNTAWANVDKALANFGSSLSPAYVESLPMDALIEKIRPSGFYVAKAACLKTVTAWFKQYGYSVQTVQKQPLASLRTELLAIKGIGHETADAILLYTFHFPTFVIDTYIRRFTGRLGLPVAADYHTLQVYYETGYHGDAETLGKYHILILEHGKKHCRKKPLCPGCPFTTSCVYAREQGM